MADPQFSEGTDPEQARQGLQALQEQGWALDEDGQGVKKTYYFRSYFKAVVRHSHCDHLDLINCEII